MKGFVSNVSPQKKSRSKGFPFFNFTIQTESTTAKSVVCYYPSKQAEIKSYAESGEAVKLLNVGQKRNLFDPEKMDVVVNKRSKIEPAQNSEITFECNTMRENDTTTKIENINSIAENVIICVNGRLAFQMDSVEKVMVRGHEMEMMERCIITDNAGSIRITLWEGHINSVQNNVCYHLTNVRVKEYDNRKYLTTTLNTIIKEVKEEFPYSTEEELNNLFQIVTVVAETIEMMDGVKKQYSCKKCGKILTEVTSDVVKIMTCKYCGVLQQLMTCSVTKSLRFAIQDGSSALLWLTAFEKFLDDILAQLPGGLSLASNNDEDICMKQFEMKNFNVQYDLSSLSVKKIIVSRPH